MSNCEENGVRLDLYNYSGEDDRYLNPADINVPPGYQVEVYASGLDGPSCLIFDEDGSVLIAESGFVSGKSRILRLRNNKFETVAEGFLAPVSGITRYKGDLYVSHKGSITVVKQNGTVQDILTGLPSYGDYVNCNVEFGPDGKMYFGQGTVTNSGVVGTDNEWVKEQPFLHDNPGAYIMLNGQNFNSANILVEGEEMALTGAFSPFGETNYPHEIRKGVVKASGSILRVNTDGTNLEVLVWGLRYPSHIKFDRSNRLYAANQGFEDRGSRPVANAPDDFHLITSGNWYGWPDYAGGDPVTLSRFQPEGKPPVDFLLSNHPGTPPKPLAAFPSHSSIMGFDFCYNGFGTYGHAYIAEFGSASHIYNGNVTPYAGYGHRVSKIDMTSGGVTTFAINKSGFSSSITREGGFSRPVDIEFGEDGAMYVLDFGTNSIENANIYYPNTGVIWKISRL